MTVSGLNIYPIKSCKGISCSSARAERRGLRFDRRWLVTDEQGVFRSQRKVPRLALISVSVQTDHLLIHAPDMPDLKVPLEPSETERLQVTIWKDAVQAIPLGDALHSWFSEFLGVPSKFVMMPDSVLRPVDSRYAVHNDEVSFADAYPYLLLSEGSLAHLNTRLPAPVPMNRFRPNIVVKGCEPYAEDRWRLIRIGKVVFHVVKSCSRCVLTTVNQDTGERGEEPLATLTTYRLQGNDVNFGQNLIAADTGTVNVGDAVEVIEWR